MIGDSSLYGLGPLVVDASFPGGTVEWDGFYWPNSEVQPQERTTPAQESTLELQEVGQRDEPDAQP